MRFVLNKTVVITGAGGVLCGCFAKRLAKEGYRVALLDIQLDAAEAVAAEIRAEGGDARAFRADVLDKESLAAAKAAVNAAFGPVTHLINGAGGNNPKGTTTNETFRREDIAAKDVVSFFDLDPQGIEFVFNLNFLGTLLTTQVFARDFVDAGHGNILNISSMNAYTPLTKIPAYSAAKAAVSNFTQWLAVHFAGVGLPCGSNSSA